MSGPGRGEPGGQFLQGNEACAMGALRAGCRFYAGYPITPSTEILEWMARELPKVGGAFLQMEDEIGSMSAVIGASWAGAKAMTATSGPGLSLMLENIGYAAITETPCVIVDIQRAGPATGQATRPASGDVMQVRWGSHGDYETIALSPWSVEEMFHLTVRAFNLAEEFRIPVFLLADEAVGHLREKVHLPERVEVWERGGGPGAPPFGDPETGQLTPMPSLGSGQALLVTGSTHDEWGYRRTQDPAAQERMIERLCRKVRDRAPEIWAAERQDIEDARVLVVAYGFTARAASRAVAIAREEGLPLGLLRLITLWPFPDGPLTSLPKEVEAIVVPEMNQGQVVREVARACDREVIAFSKTSGEVIYPREILGFIEGRGLLR